MVSISLSLVAGAYVGYCYQQQNLQDSMDRRAEERRGRIRAEQKLRSIIKEQKQQDRVVIGHIVSPYTKRMGCPRQPGLVPSSRGYLKVTVPAESLSHIVDYSHVWILFDFHANTNVVNRRTKIRPPRAPHKVGQLATRSPHRPNPIGLSLTKVERWDASERKLHLSGLDLVHGTPVIDIKPVVPWDQPREPLRVPDWVDQEDSLQDIMWGEDTLSSLEQVLKDGRLAPLYTTSNDGLEGARQTLQELLLTDPRSSHKGLKSNQRGSNSGNETYNLIFGQARVDFCVEDGVARVVRVQAIEFTPNSYIEGIPVIGI